MSKVLDTVLLFALPASGKSEVRKYLAQLDPNSCREEFHIGPTLQLDDYPYVHFMHRIDDELALRGYPYIFYKGQDRPFLEDFEWGTLVELLNEDYDDLINNRIYEVPSIQYPSASQLLFDRLDRAREKVGLIPEMGEIPYSLRTEIAEVLEDEIRAELDNKNKICSIKRKDHTIVIEAARGGANGSAFPLTPPYGYDYLFSRLSKQILDNASVLYVWVTPEESRRKNIERGKPNAQGSILHHSVPMEVMLGQYGCDDMEYLISQSSKPDTIEVSRLETIKTDAGEDRYELKKWFIPVGRFDNRKDLTTFVRKDSKDWKETEVKALHNGLQTAFSKLIR